MAESVMWEHLRTMKGLRFRRQHPIGDYIADFICLKKKLVIEIDGGYHTSQEQRYNDSVRTDDIERMGYSVIRFTNEAVLYNTQQVLLDLNKVLQTK